MTNAAAPAPWPSHPAARRTALRYALPLCIALSAAAHALLLTVSVTPAPPERARHAAAGAPGPLKVRVIADSSGATSAKIEGKSPPVMVGASALSESPAERHAPISPTPPAQELLRPEMVPATSSPAPQNASEEGAPPATEATQGTDLDDYVPRPLLSVPPVARMPVLITAPAGKLGVARHIGILSLFIDQEGRVQHIAGNAPFLPPAFEQAARDAFMEVQFAPGQIDGLAVKSRVRVEVVFDNTPIAEQ